jgi:acyl-CoA reductase-like NAD-dependent aldehyde dehydrogenase
MRVAREEVFCPVVGLTRYSELDEAIALANDTPYGLQAGVFTRSLSVAHRAASKLRYGGVMVNDASRLRLPQGPYGGVKSSGIGREGPRFAIEELTDIRLVVIDPDV